MRYFRAKRRQSGCSLLFVTCVVTCLLLVVNRVLVTSLYAALVPPNIDPPKLRTALTFLAILALLLPEWWLIDRSVSYVRAASASLEDARDEPRD